MPLFKNAADGRTVHASGAVAEARYAASPHWAPVEPEPERAYPEGQDPAEGWTVAQLTAWAGDNGVDVPAGPKPAVVEAVLAAVAERKAKAEADAANTPPQS
ncbi:hypothetical protein GCM10027059_26590 [Myceligenerans halotolerans]